MAKSLYKILDKMFATRKSRVFIFTVIFLCSFQLFFIFWILNGNRNQGEVSIDQGMFFNSSFNNDLKSCVWIPDWAIESSEKSLQNNISIDCISPVMYEVNPDGSLKALSPNRWQRIIDIANRKNITIIPTIALFDHEIFSQVLQNEENFQRHLKELLQIVEDENFDGIDLDYESIKLSDQAQYYKLVQNLSHELKSQNKKLIISVLSKWSDDIVYPSRPETRQVQDWAFLAQYADRIRIMAYEFTGSQSLYPVPIAPIEWAEEIIKYALTKAPAEKFELGIHLYSRQWTTEAESKFEADAIPFMFITDLMLNRDNIGGKTSSFDYLNVKSILERYQGKLISFSGEKIFVYQIYDSSAGKYVNKVLVFIDREGVIERKKLAAKYNLFGVAFWRLGNEGELLFE
jgi:spore germination protein YaaH